MTAPDEKQPAEERHEEARRRYEASWAALIAWAAGADTNSEVEP